MNENTDMILNFKVIKNTDVLFDFRVLCKNGGTKNLLNCILYRSLFNIQIQYRYILLLSFYNAT